MVKLSPPFGEAVVNVPEDLVERYIAGGWTQVRPPASERKPVQRKVATRRRKSADKSEG